MAGLAELDLKPHKQSCSWGPSTGPLPDKFRDMPYQPFRKQDLVGKVSDWTGATYGDSRRTRIYNPNMQLGMGTENIFAAVVDKDDDYKLVDNNKVVRPIYHRGGRRGNFHQNQNQRNQNPRFQNNRFNQRGRNQRGRGRWGRWNNWNRQTNREPSVKIEQHWEKVETLDFSTMGKLRTSLVTAGQDLYTCGEVRRYDKRNDRVSLRRPQRLNPRLSENIEFHSVPTLEDATLKTIISERMPKNFKGVRVMATDAILSALMCSHRSVIPWDIHVYKYAGYEKGSTQILLNIEDRELPSPIDAITVAETSTDPLPEENVDEINKPIKRTEEATLINQTISQQVLLNATDTNPSSKGQEEYPFESSDNMRAPSRLYRYRSFKLGSDKEAPCELIVRTEVDGYEGTPEKPKYVSVKTLNEWDPQYCNGINWRQTLEKQTNTVLATEMKNNSFKVSRWIVQAALAAAESIKLAFVTREKVKDNTSHLLVNMESYSPDELAMQAGVNMENAWGILRNIIETLKNQQEGEYYIIRNPNEKELNFYRVPDGDSEEASSEEDGEESEDGESDEEESSEEGESGESESGESESDEDEEEAKE